MSLTFMSMTTLFDEKDGATTMTVTLLAASKEIRDGTRHGPDLRPAGGSWTKDDG
jgi:hypothetical protein